MSRLQFLPRLRDAPRYHKDLVRLQSLMVAGQQASAPDIVELYRGDPLAFMTDGLRQYRAATWRMWRIVIKAAFALPLDDEELQLFRGIAERDPPRHRVKELWLIIGARAGKDSIASGIATQAACYADEGVALRPGEHALVACFATDRDQAGIVYNYTRAYFERIPSLRSRVTSSLDGVLPRPIVLRNNTEIRVVTNNFRAPRGWPIACAIFDECAFWRDENSATPDKETYIAVLRGSGPSTMIIGITTPYKQSGLVYEKWAAHFGQANDDILVIRAPTTTFRPNFDVSIIERAMAEDPEKASAEYMAEWRRDVADYVSRDVVELVTPRGVTELQPVFGVEYKAFTDPSGGSSDAMTLAIGHREEERGILDGVWERRPPFSPEDVVDEFCETLARYSVSTVRGDRYAGEWPRERFAKGGVIYEVSEESKSDIYRAFLPMLNSQRCQLLDVPRLKNQLLGLDRRTVRGGRDTIDHGPGAHDDVINSAAGVLLMAAGDERWAVIDKYLGVS